MQIVNLQIAPTAVNPVINVSQFDEGRQFQLKLYDGASAYTLPAGTTARIDGIKPDNKGFSYTDAVNVNENVLTITTKQQMTILAGTVDCEIRFVNSSINLGTLNFKMVVERSPLNDDIDMSETDIPAIVELAEEQMLNAEAWAKGTKGGIPVDDTEEQYHNNSKYYSEQAADSATAAASSEYNAGVSETNAAASEENAEAWAVGERDGVPVTSEDETYHNNSKWYAQQADDSADAAAVSEQNASDSEQAAKLSEQNAKASEDILAYYVDFVIPRFVISNNRLYISDDAQGEFIVANNRLYIKNAS